MKLPCHAVAVLLIAAASAGCSAEKPLDPQAEAKHLAFCRSVIDAVKPGDPTCGPYLAQLKREQRQSFQSQQAQKGRALANATSFAIPADRLARIPAPTAAATSDPNQATNTTGTAGDMTSQDEKLYDIEIRSGLGRAKINNARFNEIRSELDKAAGLSAAERAKSPVIAEALALSKAAQHYVDLAGCLNDQRKRGVGYYQGKSTCKAMYPDL
jgi:hypothetical protein